MKIADESGERKSERERKRKRRIVSTLTSRKKGTPSNFPHASDPTVLERELERFSRFLAEIFGLTNDKQTTFTSPFSNNHRVKNNSFPEKGIIKFETRFANRKKEER